MSWTTVAIGDVCDIVSGATPRTSEKRFWGGDILWATPKDLSDLEGAYLDTSPRTITEEGLKSCATSLLPKNSVLLSSRAPIGLVAINTVPMATNQGFKSLVPDSRKLDSKFLFHWLKSKTSFLQSLGNGATFKEISKAIVERIEIPLPPLSEQLRIAELLDKADALLRKRKEALCLTDRLGHALYRDLFGDPVSNPARLPVTNLGQLGVQMVYGPRFYNEEYSEGGTRIVRITDLSDSGELDFEAMPRLMVSEADLTTHQTRPGELLFARTGATVGKIAVISIDDPICVPGAYFIRLRFPDHIEPVFAWYSLRCGPVQEIIAERSRQSAQQNFSGPGLRRLPFTVPTLDNQRAFTRCVQEIQRMKARHSAQRVYLESLFFSLQHRALAGQL